ncbi:MAG: hypothetical protein ACXVXP_09910 [Mycobacteriaceae bacterium]
MGDDSGAEAPRPVSVAELLARNGQAVAPSGRRRRRAEPERGAPARVPEPTPEPERTREPERTAVPEPTPEPEPVRFPRRTREPVRAAEFTPEPEPKPERDAPVQAFPAQAFPAPRQRPTISAVAVRGTLAQLLPLLGSAVAGAVLWFGFRWLWAEWPVVALVLALAFTVGVVVFVRVTRRVEDLWSALLAVVVGLIVTVSPAMLTLVGR